MTGNRVRVVSKKHLENDFVDCPKLREWFARVALENA